MNQPDHLNLLLNRWNPEPVHHPAFAEQVHERIRIDHPVGAVARILQFPATLPLAAGIAVMLGVSAAFSLDQAQQQDQLANAYAKSIDPIKMTAHSGH